METKIIRENIIYLREIPLPLASIERMYFYDHRSGKLNLSTIRDTDNHAKQQVCVSVTSIDDYQWGAWKFGVTCSEDDGIEMVRRYYAQLPIENGRGKATWENFEEFFRKEGFTQFEH